MPSRGSLRSSNPVQDSVLVDQSIPFIFSVVGADAFTVGVMLVVDGAPRLLATLALWQLVREDNANALHWLAIA